MWFCFFQGGDEIDLDGQTSIELVELSLNEPQLEAITFDEEWRWNWIVL